MTLGDGNHPLPQVVLTWAECGRDYIHLEMNNVSTISCRPFRGNGECWCGVHGI